jgi:hypothetical protein
MVSLSFRARSLSLSGLALFRSLYLLSLYLLSLPLSLPLWAYSFLFFPPFIFFLVSVGGVPHTLRFS